MFLKCFITETKQKRYNTSELLHKSSGIGASSSCLVSSLRFQPCTVDVRRQTLLLCNTLLVTDIHMDPHFPCVINNTSFLGGTGTVFILLYLSATP